MATTTNKTTSSFNPFKEVLGKGLNAIQQGYQATKKAGQTPFTPGFMPTLIAGGASSLLNRGMVDSTRQVADKLSAYGNPGGTPVNVPAGKTVPMGTVPSPAATPAPTRSAGYAAVPTGAGLNTMSKSSSTSQSGLPAMPTFRGVTPEELAVQADLDSLKKQRNDRLFDAYTPSGMKTLTGAQGLASIIENEATGKEANILDKLALMKSNREQENNFNQQNFNNDISARNLTLNEKKTQAAIDLANRKFSAAQSAAAAKSASGSSTKAGMAAREALGRLIAQRGTIGARSEIGSGLMGIGSRTLNRITGNNDFNTVLEQAQSLKELEASSLLKGQGSLSDAERAILARTSGLSRNQSDEQFWGTALKAYNDLGGDITPYVADLSDDELDSILAGLE